MGKNFNMNIANFVLLIVVLILVVVCCVKKYNEGFSGNYKQLSVKGGAYCLPSTWTKEHNL